MYLLKLLLLFLINVDILISNCYFILVLLFYLSFFFVWQKHVEPYARREAGELAPTDLKNSLLFYIY